MPTINQLIRKPRIAPVKRNKVPAMQANPQQTVAIVAHGTDRPQPTTG